MPHEPKRRHSTERKGKRRASITLAVKQGIACPNCGNLIMGHRICEKCGYYKGQLVKTMKVKKDQPAGRQEKATA